MIAPHPIAAEDRLQIVGVRAVTALPSAPPTPAALPASGDPARWPWLQQLRRHPGWEPQPWLVALETGALEPGPDLLAVLAERLDAADALRLLRWCCRPGAAVLPLPPLLGLQRDPAIAAWIADRLAPGPQAAAAVLTPGLAAALLPLLGHQRRSRDWSLLQAWLEAPVAGGLRRAALEGVALGLPAWPRRALVPCLQQLASDLDADLAGSAVDLLARLAGCRRWLVPLQWRALDPAVAARLQRRLAATPVHPLLLVVHGRSGGRLPVELLSLAEELERRRGAPVRLQALTAAEPPDPAELLADERPLTLVPLLLLPGAHVRHDLPVIGRHWRRHTRLWRVPFLGAWPHWQQALARELAAAGAGALLLHHPLDGPLAARYLAMLGHRCGARCQAAPYSDENPAEPALLPPVPLLPLALAANRLTDRLTDRLAGLLAGRLAAPLEGRLTDPDRCGERSTDRCAGNLADPLPGRQSDGCVDESTCRFPSGGDAVPLLARPALRSLLLDSLEALP